MATSSTISSKTSSNPILSAGKSTSQTGVVNPITGQKSGTYNPSTGTYTSPSGQQSSMSGSNVPKGTQTIISKTFGTTGGGTSGGGGGSGGSSQPQSIDLSKANAPQVRSDIKSSNMTVQTTPAQTYNVNVNAAYQNKLQTDLPFSQISLRGVTQQQMLEGGIRQRGFTPTGKGTIETYQRPYSKEEIKTKASTQQIPIAPAVEELTRRDIQERLRPIEMTSNELYDRDVVKLQNEQNRLQQLVNTNQLSIEDATAILQDFTFRLDIARQKKVEDLINKEQPFTASKEYMKNISSEIALNRKLSELPVTLAASVALGAAIPLLPAAAATALAYGGIAYTSYGVGKTIGQTLANPSSLTKNDVIGFAVDLATIYAGIKIGGRITGGAKVNIEELNKAIDRSQIEYAGRTLTEEARIAKLKIPEMEKAEILEYYKNGNSIKQIEYKIVPRVTDAKLIQKGLGDTSIKFVEITDVNGQIIKRYSLGEVQTSKGVKIYNQQIAAQGEGLINPQTGEYVIETLSRQGLEGKYPVDVTLSRQVGKVESIPSETGRLMKGTGLTYEYGTTRLEQPRVTSKDIFRSDFDFQKFIKESSQKQFEQITQLSEKTPQLKTKDTFRQFEELVKKEGDINLLKTRGTTIKLMRASDIYKGIIGGKSEPIKILDIKAIPKKSMKPFKEPEVINLDSVYKNIKEPKVSTGKEEQILTRVPEPQRMKLFGQQWLEDLKFKKGYADFIDQLNNPQQINKAIPSTNLDTQIKSAILKAGSELNKPSKNIFAIDTNRLISDLQPSTRRININQLTSKELTSKNILSEREINKLTQSQSQSLSQPQLLSQKQLTTQINKQIEQLTTPTTSQFNLNYPDITPPVILPFGRNLEGFGSFSLKKQKLKPRKFKSKYTSSLVSAAFDITQNVTEKQFKKLQEQTFTGLETRPILNIIKEKKSKSKKSKGINFDTLFE